MRQVDSSLKILLVDKKVKRGNRGILWEMIARARRYNGKQGNK